jgi:acyl-CoA hydrolase
VAPVELDADALDLGRWIRPGDGVLWGQACGEPVPLVDAFLEGEVRAAAAFVGLSWRELPVPDGLRVVSYGGLGRLGRLSGLEIVPCHFSALPRLFAAGVLPGDVALIQVAPPDAGGRCSLGVSVDYLADALAHARVVIAEVNERCPATAGAWVEWERLDAVVHTSRPLLEARAVEPSETDERIASHVAALVSDGDTIQLGVGALPEAILRRLDGRRDLGVHSGMISDAVLRLIDAGVVTNARKPDMRGVTVTGAALGSRALFDGLHGREDIQFRPVSHTHAPSVLALAGPLVAINSAVEIDLQAQVNSEAAGGRVIGAIGGQVDFLRAAALSGGKPILALPAKRIVRELSGPVSTARADVDWVVTEHGARSLAGLTAAARTEALLELAGRSFS